MNKNRPTYAQVCGPIREILQTNSVEDFSIILWSPVDEPPEEASYILVKMLDNDGRTVVCTSAAYEGGQFFYFYSVEDSIPLDRRRILGWSYYPYDDRAF